MSDLSVPEKTLFIMAAVVLIAAGMKQAAVVLVPGILALFLAIICLEPMNYMMRRGVPRGLAITIVVLGLLGLSALVALIISGSLVSFTNQLPQYQAQANVLLQQMNTTLAEYDMAEVDVAAIFDPAAALGWVQFVLGALGGILSRYFLILLLIIFILIDAPPQQQLLNNTSAQIMRTVQHYFAIKTFTSFLTGVMIGFWVFFLEIDYPLLWGFLGFLLNYIPNIGSVLAAIPPILLALLFQGYGVATVATLGYVAINVFVSNAIEPRILGQQLGLKFVVIVVSLIAWGYILGPVGMLLAVPLTITLRIMFANHPSTHWISDLLGQKPDDVEAVMDPIQRQLERDSAI